MREQPTLAPLSIGFVLTPGMLTTGTALPYEMWAAANDRRRASRKQGRAACLKLVSCADGPRQAFGRLPIAPDCTLDDHRQFDVVYLPALWRNPTRTRDIRVRLGAWLVEQYQSGAHIAAVGTGVSLLAATGLLDGKAATTHWYYFERFEREFPRVDLKRHFFITQSGSLYCAASINSLADVTVNLIERAFDRSTAQHVERNFSHEIRRTYEEYRYMDGGNAPLDDELIVEAQVWIESNVAAQITVAELASHIGVSARTLDRRFRAATGTSPRNYWQRQRALLAKQLLENTNLTISEIAYRVGYQDAGHFARIFRREVSIAPSEYRQTVRAKLFRSVRSPNAPVKDLDSPSADRNT
jgi:transcriptional regulator GlxA family with amidase domain